MVIQVFENEQQVAKAGAAIIAAQILAEPQSVLGLATGSTPIELYKELVKLYDDGVISFAEVTSFNLDEYLGIDRHHDQSYFRFMVDNLFSKINILPDSIHIPDGTAVDPQAECERFEEAIADANYIDLQLLGLGRNGHIGFNEPNSFFQKATHVTDLAEDTITANARFFETDAEVPRQAISMGIGTIMEAGRILLLATGVGKAEAVKAMVEGHIDPLCQASILQIHPDVTILLDQEAASLLN